jgi:peptidyl-tRNA hydrolase, PTH1 family
LRTRLPPPPTEAEWLADGDDARFMSEVALRLQQSE